MDSFKRTKMKKNHQNSLAPEQKKKIVGFFLAYQKPYISAIITAGILLLFNVLLQLPAPLITKYLIDNVIPSKDFHLLHVFSLLFIGLVVLKQLSGYFLKIVLVKYNSNVFFDMADSLYRHIQQLPLNFFNKRHSGYMISRINEIASAESLMAETFLNILRDILTLLTGAIVILKMHFILGIISLGCLPFFILSLKYFHSKIKSIKKIMHEQNALYYAKIERNLNSIEKIKTSVCEQKEAERTGSRLWDTLIYRIKSEKLNAISQMVSSSIGLISPFFVMWYGVMEIMKGHLTLGEFFAINSFIGYLFTPAQHLTEIGYTFSRAMAGLERVYEIFMAEEEPSLGKSIEGINSIRFKDVSFSYAEGKTTLDKINISIGPKDKIAIVGRSGGGKSTIMKLILKLYTPKNGEIFISGENISDISPQSLRQRIAYVSQTITLLDSEWEEKRSVCNIRELLERFRVNIDEKDVFQKQLSGGETQRLEVVDAILKNADVLLVDEGTSNLDYEVEKEIIDELLKKYEEKIVIFVAHRLNSICHFERILVVDDGKIQEEGNHTQLLEKKGIYWNLWNTKDGNIE